MVVTIHEGSDKTHVMLGSKDKRFAEAWGNILKIPVSNIYKDLAQITSWANNTLKEELLFEIS